MISPRDIREEPESLRFLRLMMVLSSLSPLFVLWAIRGAEIVPDKYFVTACILLATIPTTFLAMRILRVKKGEGPLNLTIGPSEDRRADALVYLFAVLLPFYREELATCTDLAAMLVALSFIIFLFWHLGLHHINVLFALAGYRMFAISPPESQQQYSTKEPFVMITRRRYLETGERVMAYRISSAVYLEATS